MKNFILKLFIGLFIILLINSFALYAQSNELLGAGATFPYPLYSKMFSEYSKAKGIKINYQAIGSGGGINQLLGKTVVFAGTDAYLTNDELKKAQAEIIHIPTCIGAVVITYNLPDIKKPIRLTSDIIADIFLGNIKKWNDPKIQVENKDIKLPELTISIVHRSDGSGTTFVFSDYLTKTDAEWKEKVGAGKELNWPAGLGGKGNPGVAGLITQVKGSIGYVELLFALENKLQSAEIKNKSGNYISPTLESAKLSSQISIPDDTRVTITDTDSKNGYPISSFTWIILYKELNKTTKDENKAKILINLLWWMIHEGQVYAEQLNYAKLPKEAVIKAENLLKGITFNGNKILK